MKKFPYIVGDVHLGRKFTNGVPLHRKGDRERLVMDDFERRVGGFDGPLLIQTGDLFDSFTVDEAVVLFAARVVREAAVANPTSLFVFYRGNHDASRDTNKASSFDVFKALMAPYGNVLVLTEVEIVTYSWGTFGFIPWHPFTSAAELACNLIDKFSAEMEPGTHLDGVFGHWDVEGYGSKDHDFNMVPSSILSKVTKTIYTGHIHKPTEFDRDGVRVNVVGSMQPYAHGEDPATTWYKTTTFDAYQQYGETEKAWCRNLNMRIIVADGEVPEPCDCLSFTTKKAAALNEEEADLDVQIADFDMDKLFQQSLNERGVTESVTNMVLSKFKELRNA